MKKYTYDELSKMNINQLEEIKEKKQEELYERKKKKHMVIVNILSLQGMIDDE